MPRVRAAVLLNFPELARQRGLQPSALFQRVGFDPAWLATPDRMVSGEAMVKLLEMSAAESRCMTFGLQLGELRKISQLGITSLLLIHQPTLRATLQLALKYLHLLNEMSVMHLEEGAKQATLKEELLANDPLACRQATELLLEANVQLFRAAVGDAWRPLSVSFRHSAPDSLEVHHRVFRCRCIFNASFNGITFATPDLDLPNPAADASMAAYGRLLVESVPAASSGSIVSDVRRMIYAMLPLGRATIKQTASALGLTVRQLQHGLIQSEKTFSELLSEVRHDLVPQYLQSKKFDIGQIAGLLGFSRHPSFTRWFIQQYGMSPQTWRLGHTLAP